MLRIEKGDVGFDREAGSLGPAFTYVAPKSLPMPVLIAVPHAGRVYPPHVLANMRNAELGQLRLEDRFVDKVGIALAQATGAGLLAAHAPRAMLDLNRAADDVDWDMISGAKRRHGGWANHATGVNRRAKVGLGLVPRRLPGFGEIWHTPLDRAELDRRIDSIHRPYHEFLSSELERIRDEWGAALLIDLHSMPPLRRQLDEEMPAQIVLGDRFGATCEETFIAQGLRYLGNNRIPCAHNRPYSGGYVLDRHASPPRGLHAVQVEVCRSVYLDEALDQPTNALGALAKILAGLVRLWGGEAARLGAAGQMPQAAE